MIARNKRLDALPSSVKNTINFSYNSHSEELATARQRAAEYHYAAGVQRLNIGTKTDARQAFSHFEKVVQYAGLNYRDVRELKDHAQELGTSFVLYGFINHSRTFLPHEATWNLSHVNLQTLNKKWIKYDIEPRRSYYQYEVTLALDRRLIYPPTVNTKRFTETRTITDGTEIKRDSKGKPVLDSLGNMIKVPKTLTLKCIVTEVTQQKRVRLDGTLTYFDTETNRVLRTLDLTRTVVAQSVTFSTNGDLRALSDQTRNRLRAPFVPLPNDEEMLVWASNELGEIIRQLLIDNAHLIR
jgi:hypothetical protein